MDYYVPTKLLSTNSEKTKKGEKYGYTTYIMYLSPHKQNSKGKNLCSHASAGCAKACLYNSGSARFDRVQAGKVNKTEYFLADRKGFLDQLYNEIVKIRRAHTAIVGDTQKNANGKVMRYKKFAIRLNGTSDIPFENLKVKGGKNIFELFPDIQFYDYTKNHTRFTNKVLPENYHITFSKSEDNQKHVVSALQRGYNVAVVFGSKKGDKLPNSYMGYQVIDGDISDLRFLDGENVVVGLRYKLMVGKGTAGMNKENLESNDFIVKVNDLPVEDQATVGNVVHKKMKKVLA